jgi:3-hydroxyisobutyrate dehydrogenase
MEIGLIGLGNMGGRIAKRLIEKGNRLKVFDVNGDVLNHFESLGAEVVHTPAELAEASPYVITVLPNAHIVKSVTLGENGLISGFKPGSTLIDMTTSIPVVTKEIGQELARHGVRMLDAPVSGGVKKAEQGTLAVMVGGEEDVFKKALPILQDIGTNITHVGSLGAGHTIKALNNLISASTLAITAEAMAVGVKLGLDPNKMLQVINTSSGRNNSSEVKFPEQVLTRKFEVGFTLDLMCKDLTIAMELARNTKTPMFISSSVFQLWQYAWSQGGGEMDHTAIVKYIEEMADVVIQG